MHSETLKEIVDAAVKLADASSNERDVTGPVASALIYAALRDVPSEDIQKALMAIHTS